MIAPLESVFQHIRKLPEKKQTLDFVIAALTVPFMLLLITVNVMNLISSGGTSPTPTPDLSPPPESSVFPTHLPSGASEEPTIPTITSTPTITSVSFPTEIPCNDAPQPFTISFPKENQVVSDVTPVCVVLSPIGIGYCTTTISFRTGTTSWSSYQAMDRNICLNNLTDGPVVFQMKAKSEKSSIEQQYTLNFTYYHNNPSSPSASPNP